MTQHNARIRRRFENWQDALNDSDLTVRDCLMRRALFHAEVEEAFKAGVAILPTPSALAQAPEVQALIQAAVEARIEEAVRWGFLSAAPGEWRVSDIERVTEAITAAIRTPDAPASADAGRAG